MSVAIATHGPKPMPTILPGPSMHREQNVAAGTIMPRAGYQPDTRHRGTTIDQMAASMGISREQAVIGFAAQAQQQRMMPGSPIIDPQILPQVEDADALMKKLGAAAGTLPAPTGVMVDTVA